MLTEGPGVGSVREKAGYSKKIKSSPSLLSHSCSFTAFVAQVSQNVSHHHSETFVLGEI